MRTVFEIMPASANTENCTLICEFSTDGFTYVIKDEVDNIFLGVSVYHYDKAIPSVGFPIALQILFHQHPLLSKNYKKTVINYSLPQSVLTPFALYNREQSQDVLNLICGDIGDTDPLLTDVIAAQSVYNSYRVPAAVYEVIQSQFQHPVSNHQYSVLLSQPPTADNSLQIIFYAHKIVLSFIKEGKHQLINTYNYKAPEDVTYILLTICSQFDVKDIPLKISGLIEENSALFKELHKYFSTIELTSLPDDVNYHEEILKYPAHYFSHIFAIASCE